MAPVSRRTVLAALAAAPVFAAVGCGGGGAAPSAGGGGGRTTVRFAMDWTPNTNHTGLYVAQQQGWFTDAGLDVQILPYNSTSPDTLVSSGAAEFGISFQDSFTVSKAAGAEITSVLAVLQHWGSAIGALWIYAEASEITAPIQVRDLQINDSSYQGILLSWQKTISNLTFDHVTINGTGGLVVRAEKVGAAPDLSHVARGRRLPELLRQLHAAGIQGACG